MTTYQQHPLSAAFPPLSDDEYLQLCDSITILGVQNPITIYEGQVLDGWNRYRASIELGLPCPTREIEDWVDPREFVMAQNKARRHLLAAQLIAIASKVYAWKGVGSNRYKDQISSSEPGSEHQGEPGSEAPISSRELADVVGVTQRSVEQFREVDRKAAPEVRDAVERGELGLRKAAQIAKLPPEQQAEAIKKPIADIKLQQKDSSPEKRATEAKPKSEETSAPDEMQALREEIASLREALSVMQEENESLAQVVESGDQLAQALEDARKSRDLARGQQTRINGLMTELAQAKRDAIYWKRKAEKKQ